MKQLLLLAMIALTAPAFSQEMQQPDYSTMSNFKLRQYVHEHGYVTPAGQLIQVGDVLTLGKGTMPNKSFAYVYEAATGIVSNTTTDLTTKGSMPSAKAGQKVTVKGFVANGTKKSGFTVLPVVQIGGDLKRYWIEIDNALEAKEIILSQTKN